MPTDPRCDFDKLLRYMKKVMEQIVEADYSIVYLHHGLNSKVCALFTPRPFPPLFHSLPRSPCRLSSISPTLSPPILISHSLPSLVLVGCSRAPSRIDGFFLSLSLRFIVSVVSPFSRHSPLRAHISLQSCAFNADCATTNADPSSFSLDRNSRRQWGGAG